MITIRGRLMLSLMSAIVVSSACNLFQGDDSPSPTSPSYAVTDTFSGSLDKTGSVVFTFTVNQTGGVAVTLTSITPSATTLGLGLGTLNDVTAMCVLTTSVSSVTAGTSAQLTATLNAGRYCVEAFDAGKLAGTTTVTLTVAHS